MRESLRYRPDVIVYGTSPLDYSRLTAARFLVGAPRSSLRLIRLMRTSAPSVLEFAAEQPAGLAETLGRYRDQLEIFERRWWNPATWPIRDVFAFVYTMIATRLRPIGESLGLVAGGGDPASALALEAPHYRCGVTRRDDGRVFRGWDKTNSLAYLAAIRERTGIPVVVVDWPIAHEPSGSCYNSYLTNRTLEHYKAWLGTETRRLGLPLVDLSRVLLPREYLDTLHPNPRGQRKIAAALAPHLNSVLRRRIVEVLPPA